MSRILVLLEHRENRRLLSEYLASRYDVLSIDDHRRAADQILREEPFDLGIVDGPALERFRSEIQQRRMAERSVFVPFLLVASRRDLSLAKRYLWQTVDELILAPIERLELLARAEVLLRARKISLESEQRYFALAANSPVGVAIVQENRVMYANDVLLHLLEASREQVESSDLLDWFHPEDSLQIARLLRVWEEGMSLPPLEVCVPVPSGERWLDVHRAYLAYHGRPATLLILSDVSIHKQAELELKKAKVEAEELAELKSSVLTNLSHEIRTPIAAIIGLADSVSEAPAEEVAVLAHYMKASGQRLLETLNLVLDLSRLVSSNLALMPQPFDLLEHVRETVALYELQIRERGLEVELCFPPEPAIQVCIDRGSLSRILSNLISNAIKFTHEGTVTVSAWAGEGFVEVSVSDTGVGISQEFMPQIFSEFKQESSGISRDFEGIGLGLTVAKRLTDLLGGELLVESRKGEGSIFTVRLPAETA